MSVLLRRFALCVFLCLASGVSLAQVSSWSDSPAAASSVNAFASSAQPLPATRAFDLVVVPDGDNLRLQFTPAPGYYLYRDRTSAVLIKGQAVARLGALDWPLGTQHHDENFGDVVVYHDPISVVLPVIRKEPSQAPSPVALRLTFQGCQAKGICYPPMTREFHLAWPGGQLALVAPATPAQSLPQTPAAIAVSMPPPAQAEDLRLASILAGGSRMWALASFFGFGLLLALTPCVLPIDWKSVV